MFSLAPYRISVTQKGDEVPLSRAEDDSGLVAWVFNYLENKLGVLEARQNRRVVRVARVCANSDFTFICGKFQTGEHGFTSELVDSASNQVSHERAVTEAEMIPFFFSLAVPKQGRWGVLILQRFKNFGIRDFFIPLMASQFNEEHKGSDARMHVDRLVPTTFINTLLEGSQVKTLRLVKYELPQGIEDAFGGSGFASKVSDVELVVRAKRNGALPIIDSIKDVIGGKKNTADIASISGWDYDTVKLDVEYAGRRRTIDIGKPDKVSANLDITDQVAAAADGHPVWDDILATAVEFSEGLLSAQGVSVSLNMTLSTDKEAPKLAPAKKV